MAKREGGPIHPGKILLEEFMKRSGFSQYRLAKALSVSPIRISQIIHGKRAITADTAIRLGRLFNVEPLFWMNWQNTYDLDIALRNDKQNSYQSIQPLEQHLQKPSNKIKNHGQNVLQSPHIARRYAKSFAKKAESLRDFSTILQEGLDRIFVHFQVDTKLRK